VKFDISVRYIESTRWTCPLRHISTLSEVDLVGGRVTSVVVSLRPQAIRGAPVNSRQVSQVDYRLARNAVIRNFRNGRLSQLDVCDAHPELIRVARHIADRAAASAGARDARAAPSAGARAARAAPSASDPGPARTTRPEESVGEVCPICEEANVVLVSYAFGANLGPAGHCVTEKAELSRLTKRTDELTCYVVEVCPQCRWNHLARSFRVPGGRSGR